MKLNHGIIASLLLCIPFASFSQVGIGTTSPQSDLHVEGTLQVTNTDAVSTPVKLTGIGTEGRITDVVLGDNLNLTGNVLSSVRSDVASYKIATINLAATNNSNNVFNNVNLDLSGVNKEVVVFRVVGATTGFSVTGIQGGVDGRHIIIINTTSSAMSLENANSGSTASNQINTYESSAGGTLSTQGQGTFDLVYDASSQKWIVIDVRT
ncbi:hypothetical protein ACFS5J_01110 [Flavobacterium chuncheonense]|uniref:Uncharacterized protein n=1 Tax=Flavobacterium chuncheonense TaxID=2026653 RepID=A0ABW5YHY2_9FLAO